MCTYTEGDKKCFMRWGLQKMSKTVGGDNRLKERSDCH